MNRRRNLNIEKQSRRPPSSASDDSPANSHRRRDETCRFSNDGFMENPCGLMQSSRKTSISGTRNQVDGVPSSDHACNNDCQTNLSFDMRNLKLRHDSSVGTDGSGLLHSYSSNFQMDFPLKDDKFDSKDKTQWEQTAYKEKGNSYSPHLNSSCVADGASIRRSPSISNSRIQGRKFGKMINCEESSQEDMDMNERSEDSGFCYDICLNINRSIIRLKAPLHVKKREKRNENKRNIAGLCIEVLRPGMVLLKHYMSFDDQVKIIKTCRKLGLGPGGFYMPGYRDGAKLNLKLMCLGKNWDPQTRTYGDERPCDGTKPPLVPEELFDLVKRAIKDSHAHLEKHCRKRSVEDVLPSMSPNICIVNFYTESGRLGLHQDKDESGESLRRGLPVVSFSSGDSAEFLYGDERDIDKVEKIILESGDVLIFGGKSRHIYHGVSTIFPQTAPQALIEETNLRSGRLNLTFREY